MTATCSRVVSIQHLFRFLVSEALSENRIDPISIQGVIQDEVVFSVVTDVATLVMG